MRLPGPHHADFAAQNISAADGALDFVELLCKKGTHLEATSMTVCGFSDLFLYHSSHSKNPHIISDALLGCYLRHTQAQSRQILRPLAADS